MTYSPGVQLISTEWLDALLIVVPVANSEGTMVEPLLKGMLRKVQHDELGEGEFERQKAGLARQLALIDEDPVALAHALRPLDHGVEWHSAAVLDAVNSLDDPTFADAAELWLLENKGVDLLIGRTRARETR